MNETSAIWLGDLYEVARLARKFGAVRTRVDPERGTVRFFDPRVRAEVELSVEEWGLGTSDWYWYAHIDLPDGFDMGALSRRRRILIQPYPRQVLRAYHDRLHYELRPAPRKITGRRRGRR